MTIGSKYRWTRHFSGYIEVGILFQGITNIPECVVAGADAGDVFGYICVGCPAGGTADATRLPASKPRTECRVNNRSATFSAELQAHQSSV